MEALDWGRYIAALLMVGGLMTFAFVGVRRFGIPGVAKSERTRRLRIVEVAMLSARQKLVLLRRDNVEHLIVLGPDGTTVLEKDIPAKPDPIPPAEKSA